MADSNGDGKRDTLYGFYKWLTDTHPSSWGQWRHQQKVKGFLPWYGDWMVARSRDERNSATRDLYNLDIADIKYPWLSDVMSGTADSVLTGQARRTMTYSKNVATLYARQSSKKKKRKVRRVRRY